MDEIERKLRAANPIPVKRNSPLDKRAEHDLQLILQEPRSAHIATRATRTGRKKLIFASATTLVVALAVVSSALLASHSAMASAPPLLSATPVSGSVDTVLGQLSAKARSLPSSPSSAAIAAETWSADITVKAGHAAQFVQPGEVVRTRKADLSGEVVTYAGDVKWGSAPTGARIHRVGSVLDRELYKAGAYPLLYPQAPPDTSGALADYFARYAGTQPKSSSGDYFRAIADLRNEWVLSGAQTAAVLHFIADLPGVSIPGQVNDRLGRAGIAVQTETRGSGSFRDLLIFDPNTGELLSAEQVYLGGLTDVTLAHPSVLDYTAWKESK